MTPHISALKGSIAKTVLMPGDPLRAKYIAQNFLTDVKMVNSVRNILGYTGNYKGKAVSVFASGIGMPSLSIYATELFRFYDVENIIRVGSSGSYVKDIPLYKMIIADEAYSESNILHALNIYDDTLKSDSMINELLIKNAKKLNIDYMMAKIHSSDIFYNKSNDYYRKIRDQKGCIAVEMEAYALFGIAKNEGKKAACILTISDNLELNQSILFEDREKSFNDMIMVALNTAIEL